MVGLGLLSEEVCLDMAREGRFRLEDPVGREARDAADIAEGFCLVQSMWMAEIDWQLAAVWCLSCLSVSTLRAPTCVFSFFLSTRNKRLYNSSTVDTVANLN